MDKILKFLLRHIVVFEFILLEVIAFVLIINANKFQQSIFFRYSTAIVSNVYKVTNSASNYIGLRATNNVLSKENADLRNEIEKLKERITVTAHDSLVSEHHPDLSYIEANVVYNSTLKLQNYIIIDKGASHGIEPDMGVVCHDGVVGVVQRVSDNFAIVIPIINPEQRISARIKSNKQLGSLLWEGKNPEIANMEEIPGHVKPVIGDSIVTSGFSEIFPEGIFIGTIANVYGGENAPFCELDVKLGVDFRSIEYVMVTVYRNKQELVELEESLEKYDK